jgi:DNA-binding transcriptional ArsR family regulator
MQELRALAHPLRLKLVEAFAGGARTTMQVAAELGEPPTRLYHHVNALERAGILALARTRQVRGTTERYLEVAKKRLGVIQASRVTAATRAPLRGLAAMVLDEARDDLLSAMADLGSTTKETAPVALRMLLSVSPARIPELRKRLLGLIKSLQEECRAEGPRRKDAVPWALTVAFAPRAKSSR